MLSGHYDLTTFFAVFVSVKLIIILQLFVIVNIIVHSKAFTKDVRYG